MAQQNQNNPQPPSDTTALAPSIKVASNAPLEAATSTPTIYDALRAYNENDHYLSFSIALTLLQNLDRFTIDRTVEEGVAHYILVNAPSEYEPIHHGAEALKIYNNLIDEGQLDLHELTVSKEYIERKLKELRSEMEVKDKERKAKKGKTASK